VTAGASQTFTMTPNTGYQISGVLVDGVSVGAVSTYTFSNVQAAHTISASFSVIPPITYTITATAGTGGTITPSGSVSVTAGTNQTLTIAAAAGYQTASVVVDGVNQGALSTYTFTNVQANHTISASFLATVTVPAAPSNVTATAVSPTQVNLTWTDNATNETGFRLWRTSAATGYVQIASPGADTVSYADPGVSPATAYTYALSSYNAAGASAFVYVSVTTPSLPPATYTLTASAGTGGTISPSGSVSVTAGASQTFTMTPNTGYQISGILVDGVSVGAVSTYTFSNVQAAHTISASFSLIPPTMYTLTLATAGTGTGTLAASPAQASYTAGTVVTLTAAPAVSSLFSGWSGALTGAVNPTTLTMDANKSVTATFTLKTFTLTASAGTGGTISPSGAVIVPYGGSQTFTIAPASGYQIASVLVNGVNQGAISTYTFSNVTANHTISASFSLLPTTDTTAPTVNLTTPANGALVPKNTTITLEASATDNVGVTKVEFYVNGRLKGTDLSSPYTYPWQTPGKAGKSATLQAKAYDAAGNVGRSALVTVTAQ